MVWVNTNSHVYHLQGSKYYGNTKEGKYECKTAADTEGDIQRQAALLVPEIELRPLVRQVLDDLQGTARHGVVASQQSSDKLQ